MKKCAPEFNFTSEQLSRIKELAKAVGLLEDTVKILYARGADSEEKIEKFLNPSKKHFISPFKMRGMSEGVDLIKKAKDEGWFVVVYGDYDADGICASAIMYKALTEFGIDAAAYVPERRDGYGINKDAVDKIFDEYFPQLIITVDCGISCKDEIEYIKAQGAEVLVTDHHELPSVLPDCICINPKFNDGYAYDNLCGAGVAFKVAHALLGDKAYLYLDFAAIATIADSVPLTGENRDITAEGLKLINSSPKSCIDSLIKFRPVTAQGVAFTLAPRINAAGRMGDAASALKLFLSEDENEIFDLAATLTAYNAERQKYCDELYQSAKEQLKFSAVENIVMLYDEGWNTGFVGITSAKLSDEYLRPTILFTKNGDLLKGSARSIESVNIFDALRACESYIAEYGGHSQAAGLSVKAENFEKLKSALNEYLAQNYSKEDFEYTIYTNGCFSQKSYSRLAREIELLEPFGVGNRRPLFELEAEVVPCKPLKDGSPHLSATVGDFTLLSFNGLKHGYLLSSNVKKKIIFEYNLSSYRGKEQIKGYIRDIIYDGNDFTRCEREIEVNNVLTLAEDEVIIEKIYKSKAEINSYLSTPKTGTLYIASSAETLKYYPTSQNYEKELFYPTGIKDVILISPVSCADLSGYTNVVFLDNPKTGVRLASLKGKKVIICSDIDGCEFVHTLPVEREELLNYFSAISKDPKIFQCSSNAEIALSVNSFNPACTAFALEVFRQIGLLDFSGGTAAFIRGSKRNLEDSKLYKTVQDYENLTR